MVDDKPVIVSALGAIPKRNGGIRLIHDCSRPAGAAVNDYASKDPCVYQTVNDALAKISPNWYMAKVDLHAAYRSVGIKPDHYQLTGLQWTFSGERRPTFFVDSKLCFGSRKAPAIFNRITKAVLRMLVRRGITASVVLLDDFFIAAASFEECKHALNVLIHLLRSLGFQINWKKVVGPTQALVFLGIYIDTVRGQLSLDPDKVQETIALLDKAMAAPRLSKSQLQSIAGKLNWASNVITWGRLQLCGLFEAIGILKEQHHKMRVAHLKQDLAWWRSALALGQNARRIWDDRPTAWLFTDASQSGGGAFCGSDWLYRNWHVDSSINKEHINIKELGMVKEALVAWAPHFRGQRLIVYSDNASTIAWLNKAGPRNAKACMIMKEVAFICMNLDISVNACYIPGLCNELADSISRLHEPGQIARFVSLHRQWLKMQGLPVVQNYWLLHHMSYLSLQFLSPQVRHWQHLVKSWMRRFDTGGCWPLQNQQNQPTGHIEKLTLSSVLAWVAQPSLPPKHPLHNMQHTSAGLGPSVLYSST